MQRLLRPVSALAPLSRTCTVPCSPRRHLCQPPTSPIPSEQPSEQPSYITQKQPTYTLPFYGASDQELLALSDVTTRHALRAYGGLIRPRDSPEDLRQRLRRMTAASYRPSQLTIQGVVVSNKMDKSVVVAARRRAYVSKLQKHYFKTRRFMAHDEPNLCREGDHVVIRSCRLMSKRKSHIVVQNYGDPTRSGADERSIVLPDDDDEKVVEDKGNIEKIKSQ